MGVGISLPLKYVFILEFWTNPLYFNLIFVLKFSMDFKQKKDGARIIPLLVCEAFTVSANSKTVRKMSWIDCVLLIIGNCMSISFKMG